MRRFDQWRHRPVLDRATPTVLLALLVLGMVLTAVGCVTTSGNDGGERADLELNPTTVPAPNGRVYETEIRPSRDPWRPPILDRPGRESDRLPLWVVEAGWPELAGVRAGPSARGFTAYVHPRSQDGFCMVLVDEVTEQFHPACATFAEHTNQGGLEPLALAVASTETETVFAGLLYPDAVGVSHPGLDSELRVVDADGVFLAFGDDPNLAPVVEYRWEADRAVLVAACERLHDRRDLTVLDRNGDEVTAAACEDGRVPRWTKVYTQAVWERFGQPDPPITVDVTDYGRVQTLAATPSSTDEPRPPFLSRIARSEIVEEELAVFWWFESDDGQPLWCVHAIDVDGVEATNCTTETRPGGLRVALDDDRTVQVVTANFDMAFFTVTVDSTVDSTVGSESAVQVTNGRRRGAVVVPPGPAVITLYTEDGEPELTLEAG